MFISENGTGLFSRSLIDVRFCADKEDSFSVLFVQRSSLHCKDKCSRSQTFPLHSVVEFRSVYSAICFPSPANGGGKEKAKGSAASRQGLGCLSNVPVVHLKKEID